MRCRRLFGRSPRGCSKFRESLVAGCASHVGWCALHVAWCALKVAHCMLHGARCNVLVPHVACCMLKENVASSAFVNSSFAFGHTHMPTHTSALYPHWMPDLPEGVHKPEVGVRV